MANECDLCERAAGYNPDVCEGCPVNRAMQTAHNFQFFGTECADEMI
jgi:hypothetical protein